MFERGEKELVAAVRVILALFRMTPIIPASLPQRFCAEVGPKTDPSKVLGAIALWYVCTAASTGLTVKASAFRLSFVFAFGSATFEHLKEQFNVLSNWIRPEGGVSARIQV